MSNTFAFRMLHFKAIESSNPTANDTSSPRGIFNRLNLQQNDRAHENRKYEIGSSSSREQECVAAEHPPARCVQAAHCCFANDGSVLHLSARSAVGVQTPRGFGPPNLAGNLDLLSARNRTQQTQQNSCRTLSEEP